MKGKRNEAFFQQSKGTGSASRSSSHQSNMLMQVYKTARKTGTLNLSSKDLSRVPLDIFSLETKLESDENFWEITPLIKLDLSYNELQELPAEVGNLIDLMTLKLRNNSIQILPTSLGNCLKLRHLDLSSNSLSSIPPLSGPLPDLQECYLSENQFTQLPLFLYQAYELKVLEINSNQLRNLLPEIQNLRQLTRLCLNNNSLEELPAAIVTLRNLQVLDARKNRLSHLPNLGQLINLQLLDLGENQLTSFPSLPLNGQLGRLHLDWNHLRSIDEQEIYKISSTLFELHLHDNKIVSLPREIAHCASLKVLDVSNNDLNDIPATIGYMEALQRSRFTSLSQIDILSFCRFLLDGNPIRAIRRTLLTQSTHDLKKYLRTRGPPLEGTEAKKETQDDEKGSSERELIRRMRDIE